LVKIPIGAGGFCSYLVGKILDGLYKYTPTASADMVALKEHFPRFTTEEYFAWEEQQFLKSSGVGGRVRSADNCA
jgi:hypothetical protein